MKGWHRWLHQLAAVPRGRRDHGAASRLRPCALLPDGRPLPPWPVARPAASAPPPSFVVVQLRVHAALPWHGLVPWWLLEPLLRPACAPVLPSRLPPWLCALPLLRVAAPPPLGVWPRPHGGRSPRQLSVPLRASRGLRHVPWPEPHVPLRVSSPQRLRAPAPFESRC